MSGSVNKVILVGRLAADPEIRTLTAGTTVAHFTVVTSESWKDKATGERKERAEFNRVVVFNERLAETSEAYLRKGSQVYIEGTLQTRKWKDKDGNDRYSTEIVLAQFGGVLTMIGPKPESETPEQEPASKRKPRQTSLKVEPETTDDFDDGDFEDDIPF